MLGERDFVFGGLAGVEGRGFVYVLGGFVRRFLLSRRRGR